MANTDIIDEIVSSEAYADVVKFQKKMQELAATFDVLAAGADKANISISQTKGVKELQNATKKLNEENIQLNAIQKEIESTVKAKAAADAKLILQTRQISDEIIRKRLELQKNNKETKAEIEFQTASTGSIARAEAAIKKLNIERKKLNLLTEDGRAANQRIIESLDRYNNFITKNADAQAKQSRNVGNYQGSAKIIVDALEKEKKALLDLQKTRISVQNAGSNFKPQTNIGSSANTISGSAGGSSNTFGFGRGNASINVIDTQIEESTKKIQALQNIVNKPQFLNLAANAGDATKQLAFFKKALIDLEVQGQGNSKEAIKLRKDLAELTDTISDAKAEVKALSSDTRGFDLFAGSVTFAADAFQTFAGAAVLAGASEEDAAEATKTLVAVQSVANGVKGIANELTTRGTAANKLFAFSQMQIKTAMDATASSGARLKAVLITIGIGALIVGIGLLISNFSKLEDMINGTTDATKAANAVNQKSLEIGGENIVKMKSLVASVQEGKLSFEQKTRAVNDYNKTFGETFGIVKSYDELEKKIIANGSNYIKYLGLKARAEAAYQLSIEASKKALEAEAKSDYDNLNAMDKVAANTIGFLDLRKDGRANWINKNGKQNRNDATKEANELVNVYTKMNDDITKEMDALGSKIGVKEPERVKYKDETDQIKKNEDAAKKAADARKKAEEDAKKQAADLAAFFKKLREESDNAEQDTANKKAEDIANHFKRIANDEKQSIDTRIDANKSYYELLDNLDKNKGAQAKEDLLIKATDEEAKILKVKVLSGAQTADLKQRLAKQFEKIDNDTNSKISENLQAHADGDKEIIKKALEERIKAIQEAAQTAVDLNTFDEATALEANQNLFNEGKISKEKYELEKTNIQNKYALKRLTIELNAAQDILDIQKAAGVDSSKADQELFNIRLKIKKEETDELTKKTEEALLKEKEIAAKKKELYKELFGEIKNTVFAFIDAGFEKEKNNLAKESNLLEQRKEAELKRINALQISEADKADKIILLNASVENQKRLIEQRQKQVDIRKAKADKAKALLDIGIKTAVAIVSAFPNPILMALAGAIGLAQAAAVLATKIPEYYTGIKATPNDGLAIIGDRHGREGLKFKGDKNIYETPATATLSYLPKGTEVINNKEYEAMLNNSIASGLPVVKNDNDFYNMQLRKAEMDVDKIVKAIENSPKAIFNLSPFGISEWEKSGQSYKNYYDKRVRFKS